MMASFEVSKSPIEKDLINKVEPIVRTQGLELCDVEVQGNGSVVRVFLESREGLAAPLGIDECEKIHRLLGPMFDVWDPIKGNYTLEVSTPGETPPLRLARHFKHALEQAVQFETLEAIEMPAPMKPRKRWKAKLVAVDESEGMIKVNAEGGEFNISISKIKDATWLRSWELAKPTPKKSHKRG